MLLLIFTFSKIVLLELLVLDVPHCIKDVVKHG
nr:MAG TPA: hypothetical protein [Caudoviricetes sp.]